MESVGLRELRQNASELVRRVEAGETITITVSGREVAKLSPLRDRTWVPGSVVNEWLSENEEDPEWAADRDLIDGSLQDPFERWG